MLRELLIYGGIYSYSSIEFIQGMNEIQPDDELVVRINTEGGDVLFGWGMVAKFMEHQGPKKVKVDGKAFSMGAFFLAYADDVEALDVSQFLIHRAAYPSWFEQSEYFTPELQAQLKDVNDKLMGALAAKIDVAKLQEIKGVKLKDIFSMDSRMDVMLNADQAKQIGLVDTITKITPKKMKAISSEMTRIAAHYAGTGLTSENEDVVPVVASIDKTNVEPKKEGKMSPEEFKLKHPEAYNAIVGGAVKAERDRVGAWLQFNDVDAKAVAEGIKSGEDLSQTAMAEFSKKMFATQNINSINTDNAPVVETNEEKPGATAEGNELENFEARVAKNLGVKL